MSTTKWVLDPTHSEIGFKVRHMMLTNVSGQFGEFTADAETEDEDFNTAKINFSAAIKSINTNNEQRDQHLQSPDFFDKDKYPAITFKSSSFVKQDEDTYKLEGDLTIKEVTKKVTLQVEFGGVSKDPWGNTKAGFSLSGKINREDFGLTWNAALETGGVLVSSDVKLHAEIQMVKQA